MTRNHIVRNTLAFGIPVAAAAGLMMFAVLNKKPPQQTPPSERAQAVRIVNVVPTTFVPKVIGYGAAEPARVWDAVAQVAGRVEFVHAGLRSGALLKGGTEIIRISRNDYEIAVSQAEANLESSKAKLLELTVQAENAENSLEIEVRSLEFNQAELERKRRLVTTKVISQSALEDTQRTLLLQQAKVQDIKNTIRLSPSQIEAQKRQIDVNTSEIAAAKLNLARTSIRLPFDARIASETVEATQFVNVGTKLATVDDIAVAEVKAQMPQNQFVSFVKLSIPEGFVIPTMTEVMAQGFMKQFGWSATVRLRFDDRNATWPARVIRTSDTVDPKTRTVGAIVAVENPYSDIEPGKRPPLVKGMFVQVEIAGKPIKDQIVIPRSAIREGHVYIADSESRLRMRKVDVLVEQEAVAVIEQGLTAGEKLVVSDVVPAIEGMLLDPYSVDRDGEAVNPATTDKGLSIGQTQ